MLCSDRTDSRIPLFGGLYRFRQIHITKRSSGRSEIISILELLRSFLRNCRAVLFTLLKSGPGRYGARRDTCLPIGANLEKVLIGSTFFFFHFLQVCLFTLRTHCAVRICSPGMRWHSSTSYTAYRSRRTWKIGPGHLVAQGHLGPTATTFKCADLNREALIELRQSFPYFSEKCFVSLKPRTNEQSIDRLIDRLFEQKMLLNRGIDATSQYCFDFSSRFTRLHGACSLMLLIMTITSSVERAFA